jgi:drug/metabolite transporter (DMT)-like permease
MPSLSDNMRAALFMMLSMAGFAFNDAMIKLSSADLALFQAIFLRGLFATALITALALRMGAFRHRPAARDRRIVALRSLAEVGSTFFFLGALFNMPIADATAILQSLPLAVTLAAAVVFGEQVGWRRYVAILVGFGGVLIIVRPGGEAFTPYAFLALGAVAWIVVRDLSTRRLSPEVPSLQVSVYAAAAITVSAGAMALVTEWRPVTTSSLGILALAGCSLLVGHIFGIMTMRIGEIAFVQPFRYTLLPWSMLFGIVFFAEFPDLWMLVGSALVVATGLFTFYRERQVARARSPALSPGLARQPPPH